MTRRILTILSALSLLLCAVTIVLGVRSYWWCGEFCSDEVVIHGGIGYYSTLAVCCDSGRVGFHYQRYEERYRLGSLVPNQTIPSGRPRRYAWRTWPATDQYGHSGRFGFYCGMIRRERPAHFDTGVVLPCWFAACVFSMPAIVYLLHLRRRAVRNRIAAGQCSACGYDLRASKERCPECGTVIPQSAETPSRS